MGSSKLCSALGSVTVALSRRKVRPSGGGMQFPFGQPVGFVFADGDVFAEELGAWLEVMPVPMDEPPPVILPLADLLEDGPSLESRGLVSISLGEVPRRFLLVFFFTFGVPARGGGLGVMGTLAGIPTVGN